MPLSKHFYSLDEVQAALFYSASRYDAKEAMFWCKEMIDSGCIGEAISTLFESWMFHKGHLPWLVSAWTTLRSEELTEDAILQSVYQLCSCRMKDHSLWNILALTGEEVDRVTPKTPALPLPLSKICPKELYFLRAVHQGKARSAWWISQHMDLERLWWLIEWFHTHVLHKSTVHLDALKGYEDLLGYKSDEYDAIVRCCAVLSCVPRHHSMATQPTQPMAAQLMATQPMPSDIKDAVASWKKLDGRKARRIYSIPTVCLYGTTQRGNMKWSQHNLVQLYQVEMYLMGCPFWDTALSEYAIIENDKIIWNSEETRCAFYQRYFPDDIPDEWTLAEKKKSHGDGVLGPTEQVTLCKYARSNFSSLSRLAWGSGAAALIALGKRSVDDCALTNVVCSRVFPLDMRLLAPVHKRCKV